MNRPSSDLFPGSAVRNPDAGVSGTVGAPYIPLSELLVTGRPPLWPVATGDWEIRTFSDFLLDVGSWRAAFASRPEERWALFTRDTWRFATSLFGAWAAGRHVVVPGDDALDTRLALEHEVGGFAGDLESPSGLPRIRRAPRTSRVPESGWARFEDGEVLLTVYTSGSTGEPVGVPKRFSQLVTEVEALERTFGAKLGPSSIVATVSHQHIYGLLFRVLWPLAAGRLIDTRQLFYPHEVLAVSRRKSLVALVTSPAHLKRLPEGGSETAPEGFLTAVFSSGGPLSEPEARNAAELLGVVPSDILGSSETGGIAWRQETGGGREWTPLPFVEIEIDGDGVLSVRSPQAGGSGWLATADRARILPGGGFELLGRADRIIKIEEKRISLAAVEQALVASGLATQARVLPLPGSRLELGAVVIPSSRGQAVMERDGKQGLQRSLREAAVRRVERAGLPRRFRFLAELPVDGRGKVTQQALAGLFQEPHGDEGSVSHDTREPEIGPRVDLSCSSFSRSAPSPAERRE